MAPADYAEADHRSHSPPLSAAAQGVGGSAYAERCRFEEMLSEARGGARRSARAVRLQKMMLSVRSRVTRRRARSDAPYLRILSQLLIIQWQCRAAMSPPAP